MPVEARYALRSILVGIAGFVSALQATIPITWDDVLRSGLAAIGSALAYAGIGALVPVVEPNIGNKLEKQ